MKCSHKNKITTYHKGWLDTVFKDMGYPLGHLEFPGEWNPATISTICSDCGLFIKSVEVKHPKEKTVETAQE